MIRKIISVFSILLFIGLSIVPFIHNDEECDLQCCNVSLEEECSRDATGCPMSLSEGNTILIFPLVSAPLTKYNPVDHTPIIPYSGIEKAPIALTFELLHTDETEIQPPIDHLTPLRI